MTMQRTIRDEHESQGWDREEMAREDAALAEMQRKAWEDSLEGQLAKRIQKLEAERAWRPISEHTEVSRDPDAGWIRPAEVLLHGPNGTHIGRVFRFDDGEILTRVAHIAGDAGATHYMPLPDPPASGK